MKKEATINLTHDEAAFLYAALTRMQISTTLCRIYLAVEEKVKAAVETFNEEGEANGK